MLFTHMSSIQMQIHENNSPQDNALSEEILLWY